MNAIGCAIARIVAPLADFRSHGGFDHSSVSLGFRLSQTDSPHCVQYLSSWFLRSYVPQRKQGFSRARGSDVNCLTYTRLPRRVPREVYLNAHPVRNPPRNTQQRPPGGAERSGTPSSAAPRRSVVSEQDNGAGRR
jgi:hypothetical protein